MEFVTESAKEYCHYERSSYNAKAGRHRQMREVYWYAAKQDTGENTHKDSDNRRLVKFFECVSEHLFRLMNTVDRSDDHHPVPHLQDEVRASKKIDSGAIDTSDIDIEGGT